MRLLTSELKFTIWLENSPNLVSKSRLFLKKLKNLWTFIVGASFKQQILRPSTWWLRFSRFKNASLPKQRKFEASKSSFNSVNNSLNLYRKFWSDSHRLRNNAWFQFMNKLWSRSKDRYKVCAMKSKITKKLYLSTKSNTSDCRKSYRTTNKSFSRRRKDNSKQRRIRRHSKTISKLFCQIKDSQEEVLTLPYDHDPLNNQSLAIKNE